ncbi:hypothetical protein [Nocardia sp. NBC_01327]|uniref:hypothetical protein n=1 Tax=Nocardia sp. NBC_01327 TaxID=2903593 RepID=UPI002E124D78|nr:hypothetical protein OG326_23995 [Nocardia sp. NBC_01327]
MNRLRKAWPIAKLIVAWSVDIPAALLVVFWAVYGKGWINADEFTSGVSACLATIFTGTAVAALWMVGAGLFFDDEER